MNPTTSLTLQFHRSYLLLETKSYLLRQSSTFSVIMDEFFCEDYITQSNKTTTESLCCESDQPGAGPGNGEAPGRDGNVLNVPYDNTFDRAYIAHLDVPMSYVGNTTVPEQPSHPRSPRGVSAVRKLARVFTHFIDNENLHTHLSASELKLAIGSVLEAALMGSALVLTVSLQLQEVVGGRGGLHAANDHCLAKYTFVIACASSFGLCFFTIILALVLLLEVSHSPPRYVTMAS